MFRPVGSIFRKGWHQFSLVFYVNFKSFPDKVTFRCQTFNINIVLPEMIQFSVYMYCFSYFSVDAIYKYASHILNIYILTTCTYVTDI